MVTIPITEFQDRASVRKSRILFALQIVFGALYLTLLTQVRIPLNPVPITLQTFAIFTLGFYYGSSRAAYSVLLFLGAATIGLPVFGSFMSNPLWFIGPKAGYLIAFPIAAYVIGKLSEKRETPSFIRLACSVLAGQAVIYALGVSWLSFFVGVEKGIYLGLVPFIPMAVLKLLAAVSLKMGTSRWI